MFEEIYNFLKLSDSLYSGGMPKLDQMREAPVRGIEVVINLAPADSHHAIVDEAALVKSLGMEYIHIPVNWNTPARDGLFIFMDEMDKHADKKIFVHCEANFRATAFIALYRILRLSWKDADAFTIMHTIWDEDAFPVWKMFIDGAIKESRKES